MSYHNDMNERKNIKMILFDQDDTLLPPGEDLSEKTKETLIRLHDNGILLVLASGRPVNELASRVESWNLPFGPLDALIGYNGCEWKNCHTGQLKADYTLDTDTIRRVLETMQDRFEYVPMMYRDPYLLTTEENETMRRSAFYSNRLLKVAPLEEMWARPAVKVMLRTENDTEVPRMELWLKDHPIPGCDAFKTQTTLMEFAPIGISKATPMEEIGKQFGVRTDEMIAFGDTTNDNEMLKQAGLGVALKNAAEDTLAIADEVTDFTCKEDGLARYLEDHHPELFEKR